MEVNIEHRLSRPALAADRNQPQPRAVRLVSEYARVDDPVRVTVAGVEVEGGHVWSHDESNPNSPSAWMVVKNRWSDPFVFPSTPYEMVLMQGSADQAAAGRRLP